MAHNPNGVHRYNLRGKPSSRFPADPHRPVHVRRISLRADVLREIYNFIATQEEGNEFDGIEDLADEILRMIRNNQEHA